MTIRLVVENCNRFGQPIEVFEVTELYDLYGNLVADKCDAVSMVVNDGTCHHVLDPECVPIYTVH